MHDAIGRKAFAVVILGGVLSQGTPAHADFRILESTVAQIKQDAVLPDSAKLIVPEGGKVTVYFPSSHETKVIVGPYEGRAADYKGPNAGTGAGPTIGGTRSPPFGGTRQPEE